MGSQNGNGEELIMDKIAYYVNEIEKVALNANISNIKKKLEDMDLSIGAYESTKDRNDFYKNEFDYEPIPKHMEIVGEDGYGNVFLYDKNKKKIFFHDHEDPEDVSYDDGLTYQLGLNSNHPGGYKLTPLQQKLLEKGIEYENQLTDKDKADLGVYNEILTSKKHEGRIGAVGGTILGATLAAAPFIKDKNPWMANKPKAKYIAAGLGALLGGIGGWKLFNSGNNSYYNHNYGVDKEVSNSLRDLRDYGFYDKVACCVDGIEKTALNAQKAREMAKKVGLIPEGQWKWALRKLRDGRGNPLPGKELAKAKEDIGLIPNNAKQKIDSINRRVSSNKELMGAMEGNKIKNLLAGDTTSIFVPKDSESKIVGHEFHTHPVDASRGELRQNMRDPQMSERERSEDILRGGHRTTKPSGANAEEIQQLMNKYKKTKGKGVFDIDTYNKETFGDYLGANTLGDTGLFALRSTHNPNYKHTIYSPDNNHQSVHKLRPQGLRSVYFDKNSRAARKEPTKSDYASGSMG